jgi:dUTP pyrophosphatase
MALDAFKRKFCQEIKEVKSLSDFQTIKVQIMRTQEAKAFDPPSYATPYSSGVDLRSVKELVLLPGKWALVPTGISIALPMGYEAQIRPRSGLAVKHGVTLLNSPGTIDSDYRGEIQIILINHGSDPFPVHFGDRIAQMVVMPVAQAVFEEVRELSTTARGAGGFGSTGER